MINYRFLTPEDKSWLQQIVRVFRHQEVTDEKASQVLSDPSIQIQLAWEDDQVGG
ncbi:MAG: hypothetical protein IJI05_06115 [Erysipelotrichaceae bacterium]|nr:hypothetical protein [Erysipelotrichaceae bacterium]